jgi:Ca2+/Na+ antiporter
MRDITITSKRIKRELIVLLGCLLTAIIINIAAIINYQTSWWEILTQLGYEIVIAFVLYLILLIIRAIKFFVLKISVRRKIK